MTIRKAIEKDRKKIIKLLVELDIYLNKLSNTEIDISKLYDNNNRLMDKTNIGSFYLLVVNGKTVGIVTVWDNRGEITLNNLYIREEYRGNGYCSELINYILKDIKEDYIVLGVYHNNIIANNVYRHLGFKLLQDTGDLLWLIKERKNEYV